MNRDLDIKKAVLEEYDNGAKATDLAKKYDISRGTIYLWIDQRKKGMLTFDDELINSALKMFNEDNLSVKEIAARFNVTVPTVYTWLRMRADSLEKNVRITLSSKTEDKDAAEQEALVNKLIEENRTLKEENKKLNEEVELYKSLLSKLNTFIDKTSDPQRTPV